MRLRPSMRFFFLNASLGISSISETTRALGGEPSADFAKFLQSIESVVPCNKYDAPEKFHNQ